MPFLKIGSISVILVRVAVLLLVLPVHEYAHAYVAYKLGDDTALLKGRLTLNPFSHIDLIGALCMVLGGFGWMRPVPINPMRFKKVSPKKGMALTALAGPLSNLLFAFIFFVCYKVLFYCYIVFDNEFFYVVGNVVFSTMSFINIGLAVFNFIPVPPLDGSRIIFAVLPERYYWSIMKYERYISIGFFILIFTGVLDTPLAVVENFIIMLFDKATFFIDLLF